MFGTFVGPRVNNQALNISRNIIGHLDGVIPNAILFHLIMSFWIVWYWTVKRYLKSLTVMKSYVQPVIMTVPSGDPAPVGAQAVAGIVMTKFCSHVCMWLALEWLILEFLLVYSYDFIMKRIPIWRENDIKYHSTPLGILVLTKQFFALTWGCTNMLSGSISCAEIPWWGMVNTTPDR